MPAAPSCSGRLPDTAAGCSVPAGWSRQLSMNHGAKDSFSPGGIGTIHSLPAVCCLFVFFFFFTTPDFEGPAVSFLLWACSRHMTAHRWIRVCERAHEPQGQEPARSPGTEHSQLTPGTPALTPAHLPSHSSQGTRSPRSCVWTHTRDSESALQQILDRWKSSPEGGMSLSPWPQGWKQDRGKQSFLTPPQKIYRSSLGLQAKLALVY